MGAIKKNFFILNLVNKLIILNNIGKRPFYYNY